MRTSCLFFTALLLMLIPSASQAIVLVAAELPPYVIRAKQGNPSGMVIEIMEEAARRLGEPLTVELMPLARALTETNHRQDVLFVPPVRSARREHLYDWIAPLLEEDFVIVTDRRHHPVPLKVRELPALRVGTLRYSFGDTLLKQRLNLASQTVATEVLNAHKLHRGRINAWVAAWNTILYNQQLGGYDEARLVRGKTLMSTSLFVAANKAFPAEQKRRWQATLARMRADGSLARIIKQYHYQAPVR